MNARDISQKSFSPIQSEIFASQKQSHLEFKDRQHNYNNYIKPNLFLKDEAILEQWKVKKIDEKKFRS